MKADEEAMDKDEEVMDEETFDEEPTEKPSKSSGFKVYVGNLPFSVDEEELRNLFSSFGEISEVSLIINKFSGRSKGFGFVTFAKKEDSEKAIAKINEKEVQGRALKVSEAKPMEPDRPRPRRSFGGGGSFGGGRDRNFGGRGRSGGRDRQRRF